MLAGNGADERASTQRLATAHGNAAKLAIKRVPPLVIEEHGAAKTRVWVEGGEALAALDCKNWGTLGGTQNHPIVAAQRNAAVVITTIVGRVVAKWAGDTRCAGERCIGQHGISSVVCSSVVMTDLRAWIQHTGYRRD